MYCGISTDGRLAESVAVLIFTIISPELWLQLIQILHLAAAAIGKRRAYTAVGRTALSASVLPRRSGHESREPRRRVPPRRRDARPKSPPTAPPRRPAPWLRGRGRVRVRRPDTVAPMVPYVPDRAVEMALYDVTLLNE